MKREAEAEQCDEVWSYRKAEKALRRPFKVGDHVELAMRLVERMVMGVRLDCSKPNSSDAIRMEEASDGVLYAVSCLDPVDDEPAEWVIESWGEYDLIVLVAEFSGMRINDESDEGGVVRLTHSDMVGIVSVAKALLVSGCGWHW